MRILILEDEILTALDIKGLIEDAMDADVVMCPSVRSASPHLDQRFDFAFLDIDVQDGKSFEIAHALLEAGTPFVFVSGASPAMVPAEFRDAMFVAKPFSRQALLNALRASHAYSPSMDADAQAS